MRGIGGGGRESGSGRGGGGGGGGRGNTQHVTCEDRFYTPNEYRDLIQGNKMWLKHIRDQRHENNIEDAEQAHKKRQKTSTERSITVLVSAVGFMQVEASDADTDTNPKDDGKSTKLRNSTNSALKRIETR